MTWTSGSYPRGYSLCHSTALLLGERSVARASMRSVLVKTRSMPEKGLFLGHILGDTGESFVVNTVSCSLVPFYRGLAQCRDCWLLAPVPVVCIDLSLLVCWVWYHSIGGWRSWACWLLAPHCSTLSFLYHCVVSGTILPGAGRAGCWLPLLLSALPFLFSWFQSVCCTNRFHTVEIGVALFLLNRNTLVVGSSGQNGH